MPCVAVANGFCNRHSLMKPKKSAEPFIPTQKNIPKMAEAVDQCRGCDLYKNATQGVFGGGSLRAKIVFVGEQPGNAEDLAGEPFVGPAGKLLDSILKHAGISRSDVYVTNAVKHFKFERKEKLRIHKKPSVTEVRACQPWLRAELETLRPVILVCLGATAALSVFDHPVKISDARSKFLASKFSENTFVTVHPSSILRSMDKVSRDQAREQFLSDIKKVAARLCKLVPK
jgi:uracil-DNA glycosylase family protein